MAKEDVNIKVTANVAEAIQMWKAMEAGPEGMAKSLAAMGQKGQASTKGLVDEVVGLAGKWATVGAAVAGVTDELRRQAEVMRRMREERVSTTNSVDEVWTRFQVQSGIPNGSQADLIRTQLMSTIANRKAAPIPGLLAAEQLGSAGASVQDITGGGLDEFLKMTTAANAAGKDVNQAELAKATVMFLKANKLQPNREGMAGTSLAIQKLFGGTNLQVSNLQRFAPEASTIAKYAHIAPEDQLAQYSMFLDTMDESGGSVAYRSGILKLATAGGEKEKTRALAMLGLKPGDVDFQGEDWKTVYSRLQKGFAGVSGDKRNIAAKQLFGEEGMGFYNVLLQEGSLADATRRGAMARDSAGAAAGQALAEGSRAAGARQAETLAANAMYDTKSIDMKVVVDRMKGLGKMLNLSDFTTGSVEDILKDESDFFGMFDVSPEERIRRASLYIERWSGVPNGPAWKANSDTRHVGRDEASQYLRGERPIRIVGPDGLDIPTEPAATGLSQ